MAKKKITDPTIIRELAEFRKVRGKIKDPILLVIRIHLLIEYLLERQIICEMNRGDKLLDSGNLSFSQKITLIAAFDHLDDTYITAIREINRLRNACAHELNKKISLTDVDRIGRSLGDRYMKIRNECNANIFNTLSRLLTTICGGLAGKTNFLEEKKIKKPSS